MQANKQCTTVDNNYMKTNSSFDIAHR